MRKLQRGRMEIQSITERGNIVIERKQCIERGGKGRESERDITERIQYRDGQRQTDRQTDRQRLKH